jgi:allantoin racemase
VTTLERTQIIAEHLVEAYGMRRFCRKARATDLAVLDLGDETADARRIITAECRRALADDDSSAIVFGCAGMTDLARMLSQGLGVPVIDGVAVAVKFVEALVGADLGTSKKGDLARPIPKAYAGELAYLAPR